MKVLLLGEYSAFNKNLKSGLEQLGVQVTLASNGDVWKKIPGATMGLYRLNTEDNILRKTYDRILEPLLTQKKFYGYDVVQSIHEVVFDPYVNSVLLKSIKKHNGNLYVNKCGNSYTLYKSWKEGLLEYYTYDDNPAKFHRYISESTFDKLATKSEIFIDQIADGLIPMAYEYAVGIRDYPNLKPTIAVPIDTTEIEYSPNIVNGKLVFYHGIIRPLDKGTSYIKEAFEIIQNKYPNDVQMIVADRLPYNEYVEVLRKTNILVDCCKEHAWGMNAGIAMAQGKVVMGCATQNSIKELGLTHTPVVHIEPNTEQIVSQIEYVLENKNNIETWGYESRQFVDETHNCVKIAKQYLDTWNS